MCVHRVTVMRFWIKIGVRHMPITMAFEDFAFVIVINMIYNGDLTLLQRTVGEIRLPQGGGLKSHLNPDAAETNKLKHM